MTLLMTSKHGLLGLYWPARKQALEECSALAYNSLRVLQAHGYERFYHLGRSRRDALKRELMVNAESVRSVLEKGVIRRDVPPHRPIPELGWSLFLWSGDADDESYGLSLNCGVYSQCVPNSFVLDLPFAGRHSLAVSSERALETYSALVEIWRPEQAVLCEGSISWDNERRLVPDEKPLALLQQGKIGG
jgi:hypothetical protein